MIEFDKFFCHCELVKIQREANFWAPVAFVLTARQYGEVVLPDAASGRKIVPVGQKAVTVQGGYGAIFAVMVQILPSITSVGVQG